MSEREFQYSDGKSHKFWHIRLDGCTQTVQFGRIGTTGQTQTKGFASETEAHRASDKLIQEKLQKGYVEVTAASPSPGQEPATGRVVAAAEPSGALAVEASAAELKPVGAEPTRLINLEPADWLWATWRPWTPLPRPEPKPFDREGALARLARMPAGAHGWAWEWEKAVPGSILTSEEALFWFDAMTADKGPRTPGDLATAMAHWNPTRELSQSGAVERIQQAGPRLPIEIVIPLANLFPPSDVIGLIVGEVFREDLRFRTYAFQVQAYFQRGWAAGFRNYVLPYLEVADRARLAEKLRPLPAIDDLPADPSGQFWAPWYLAACLGMHQEMLGLVESLPDDRFRRPDWTSQFPHFPQEFIFGLRDPRLVVTHMYRLRLGLRRPEHVRAWLAHTEFSALDWIRKSVRGAPSGSGGEELIQAFGRAEAPEVAPHMLELLLESQAPRAARRWLEAHPAHAIVGLMPVVGGRGHLAEAAVDLLRAFRRKGHETELRANLAGAAPDLADRIRTEVLEEREEMLPRFDEQNTPDWLRAATVTPVPKKAKKPAWVDPTDLPPIVLDAHRLSDDQTTRLVFALQESQLAQPHPLVAALREKADRGSLDAFAWTLFQLWLIEGGPTADKWALAAVGQLGSDRSALRLAPYIRAWPLENQHARAVYGLECLRAIGTDTALMQINGIAEKVKFKALKAKAGECMEAIAQDRGLTRSELEDRIVPDCDLDERGSRLFDYGSRQFRIVLGPDLKPIIRDDAGKLRPDLPKPSGKDDLERANAAIAEWKLLKKQVAEAAKIQSVRLEHAMVTGRRWSREAFELLLVRHPLMTHLARRLVWGGYDAGGALTTTFRVTEDQTYADAKDHAIELEGMTEAAIMHPLLLTAEQRSRWGELLSDYEIVPPFPQLGRPIYRLEPGEETATEITRFGHVTMPPVSIVGTLDRLGWTRAITEDHGFIYEHSKPFYGANTTAIIQYSGAPLGHLLDWKDANIEVCFFVPCFYTPIAYHEHKDRVPLKEIDPVAISEVLGDLTVLAAKAP